MLVALALLLADLEERQRLGILCHEHVSHVGGQSVDELSAVEAVAHNLVEQYHDVGHLVFQGEVDDAEVVVGVEHVEVFDDLLIGDGALAERCHLVEDGQGIAHATVGFLGDDGQCLFLVADALLLGHPLQVGDGVLDGHALEVVNLAARDDGGQDFVLLGGGEDEDDVLWRFFERLQEGVEGCRGEHVHLVDDEHLVASYLRRDARLLHERLDVLHRVVGGRVEFEDVVRPLFVESLARLTMVAGLAVLGRGEAVDGLGEDAGAGGLSHAARAAEEVGMGQFSAAHGILQRGGERTLSDNRVECHRAVFAC